MQKSILFILLIFSGIAVYGQHSYKIYTGPLLSVSRDSDKPQHNIVGTPYFNVNFMSAIIGNTNEKAPISTMHIWTELKFYLTIRCMRSLGMKTFLFSNSK